MSTETLSLLAVQICRQKGKYYYYGSGVLVGPGRVITAAHVLCHEKQAVEIGQQIGPTVERVHVRLQSQKEALGKRRGTMRDRGWFEATRIWPAEPMTAIDAAILDVDDMHGFEGPDNWAEYGGTLHYAHPPETETRGHVYGYPQFLGKSNAERIHEGRTFTLGLFPHDDKSFRPRVTVRQDLQAIAGEAEDWGGLSGGGIFFENQLIGLVHTAAKKRHAPNELRFEAISAINEPEFLRLTGLEMNLEKPVSRDAPPNLERLDRDEEVAAMHFEAAEVLEDAGTRAVMVVQPGHLLDELAICARRYLTDVFYPLLKSQYTSEELKAAYHKPSVINLRRPNPRVDQNVAMALFQYYNDVSTQTSISMSKNLEDLAKDICVLLSLNDAPRVLHIFHDAEEIDDTCSQTIVKLCSIISAGLPEGPPLLAFVLVVTGEEAGPVGSPLKMQKLEFEGKCEMLNAEVLSGLKRHATQVPKCPVPIIAEAPQDVPRNALDEMAMAIAEWGGGNIQAMESWLQYLSLRDSRRSPFQTAHTTLAKIIQEGERHDPL